MSVGSFEYCQQVIREGVSGRLEFNLKGICLAVSDKFCVVVRGWQHVYDHEFSFFFQRLNAPVIIFCLKIGIECAARLR